MYYLKRILKQKSKGCNKKMFMSYWKSVLKKLLLTLLLIVDVLIQETSKSLYMMIV